MIRNNAQFTITIKLIRKFQMATFTFLHRKVMYAVKNHKWHWNGTCGIKIDGKIYKTKCMVVVKELPPYMESSSSLSTKPTELRFQTPWQKVL